MDVGCELAEGVGHRCDPWSAPIVTKLSKSRGRPPVGAGGGPFHAAVTATFARPRIIFFRVQKASQDGGEKYAACHSQMAVGRRGCPNSASLHAGGRSCRR